MVLKGIRVEKIFEVGENLQIRVKNWCVKKIKSRKYARYEKNSKPEKKNWYLEKKVTELKQYSNSEKICQV